MSAFVREAHTVAQTNSLWRRRSLRFQVMIAVIVINLCAALVALAMVVANGRRATLAEITASLAVAERLVAETVERLSSSAESSGSLARLPLHISGLRHVRISVEDAQGSVVNIAPTPGDDDIDDASDDDVPSWFSALLSVDAEVVDIPVVEQGSVIGHVRIAGEASDEVAEVWHDTADLAVLATGVNLAILGALYLVLGRLLRPLQTLSAGLSELEAGNFEHRLISPDVRELATIAARFNALGVALRTARADNERLSQRVIHVQDDERRQIASDLHDELGPCLFGLRANLESIDRLSGRIAPELAQRIKDRTGTMTEILDRIQGLNRRLLRQLRPMALGHVPLGEMLRDLVSDFERHSLDRRFQLALDGLDSHYSDTVEITVYRCVQEAITNALRHGNASNISIKLSGELQVGHLSLLVEDDGVGLQPDSMPGFGFIGIQERIGALGGTWTVAPLHPSGTRLEISIPVQAEESDFAPREKVTPDD